MFDTFKNFVNECVSDIKTGAEIGYIKGKQAEMQMWERAGDACYARAQVIREDLSTPAPVTID